MTTQENIASHKFTYMAQICAKIEQWEDCFKYIEEAVKIKKEDISNFQFPH